MRFVTYQHGSRTAAGMLRGQFVYDLAQAYFQQFRRPYKWPDLKVYLESGLLDRIHEIDWGRMRDDRRICLPLREVRLRAPIRRPASILCVGRNYRDHAAEQNKEIPPAPLLFSKAPSSVIGDGEDIVIPHGMSERVDYEVELAVIIGVPGFKIARTAALDHVFGYTVFNDVSARDVQAVDKQWFRSKSFATFAPMGPMVVTPDECAAKRAAIEMRVNGEVRQKSCTSEMIFDVPTLIEYISSCFALESGDVIATGTPAGVGAFRQPPVFLKPGDRLEATIEGIGTLTNGVQ